MNEPVVIIRERGRVPLHLLLVEPIELGRDCKGLLLGDPQISRRHLRLHNEAGTVIATDLASTNGTTIDGEALTEPRPLLGTSQIMMGDTTIELRTGRRETVGDNTRALRTTQLGITASPGFLRPDPKVDLRTTSIDLVAAAVAEDKDTFSDTGIEPGTVTIVFSDIESSTQRATELGDTKWMALLGVHNRIIRKQLAYFGGNEIKSQGDGFMLSFPSARGAVRCMAAAQRDFESHHTANPDNEIRIRIGIHTGEVIMNEGDLFGLHVHMAARVANEAEGGEILVSSLVRQIIEPRGDIEFGETRTAELKGITGVHELSQIIWNQPS